jgi:transcriptional regulator with XRE-family HTH domain
MGTASTTVADLERKVRARRDLPAPAARRALRELAGLSQDDLARVLNVTRSTVSRWESGEREPRPAILYQYVDLLDRLRAV